jgi:hypothetical protein
MSIFTISTTNLKMNEWSCKSCRHTVDKTLNCLMNRLRILLSLRLYSFDFKKVLDSNEPYFSDNLTYSPPSKVKYFKPRNVVFHGLSEWE